MNNEIKKILPFYKQISNDNDKEVLKSIEKTCFDARVEGLKNGTKFKGLDLS